MKIKIQRESLVEYETDLEDATLLEVLNEIKTKQDNSLSYSSGCRSSVCGSCAVRVNDKEVLACSYHAKDGDVVTPLRNSKVLRDLVVDMDRAFKFNKKAKAFQSQEALHVEMSQKDEKINELQSDCILCSSCYSACPVYAVNDEFLGPFSLTRVWRYVSDKREPNKEQKIDTIQTNGVWDCTLCNECTVVCPQGISSKADIEKLRMRSTMQGYTDPNMANFGGGFGTNTWDGSPSF
jgi:fumarate reductase iron-sulfur subunit